MAANSGYRLLIVDGAFEDFMALRGTERQTLLQAARFLTEHPFTEGDYRETDDDGFTVDVLLRGRFLITFLADHAARELRLIRVERA